MTERNRLPFNKVLSALLGIAGSVAFFIYCLTAPPEELSPLVMIAYVCMALAWCLD